MFGSQSIPVLVLASCVCTPLLSQQQRPSADAILDRFVQVTGGAAAYRSVRTETNSGRVDFVKRGGGVTFSTSPGTFTQSRTASGQSVTNVTVPSFGGDLDRYSEGATADEAWMMASNGCGSLSRTGPVLAQADEQMFLARTASPQAPANWRTLYAKADLGGVDTVDGRRCQQVVLTPKEGSPETNCYDAQSGFLVKTSTAWRTSNGVQPVEITYGDYRKAGPITAPHKRSITYAGQTTTYTVQSKRFNRSLPANRFTPPAQIRALVR